MRNITIAIVVLLLAGCSCRTHRNDEMRGMIAPANLPVEGGGPLERIHFAFDSAELSSQARSTIRENIAWLKNNGNPRVELGGNCDERGTNEYNMVLGMKRANSALNYLSSLGEDRNNFSTVSYGEELPLDPAHNESAWQQNRAVEFSVK